MEGQHRNGGRTGLRRPAAWPPLHRSDDVKDTRTLEQRVESLEAIADRLGELAEELVAEES